VKVEVTKKSTGRRVVDFFAFVTAFACGKLRVILFYISCRHF